MTKVAICQSIIIPGGRLRVIVEIARILNELGIIPDLLTSCLRIQPDQILTKYGQSVKLNIRMLPRIPILPYDFSLVFFNFLVNYFVSRYDLLINSNNSLIFLPEQKKVISYIYFPHEQRMLDRAISIHRPYTPLPRWSRTNVKRAMLRRIYRLNKPKPHHDVIGISKFTCDKIRQSYTFSSDLPVIFPPVDCEHFRSHDNRERELAIVSIGRFAPDKRQFEQIQLAERLSDVRFSIIGFVNNVDYFKKCKHYQEERQINNVHFYPDASYKQMIELLQSSKYFLHTLINEPFGITTVQAISAGCLPIVHDSGGQKEVVLKEEMRYRHFEEIPSILKRMEAKDITELQSLTDQLQEYVFTHFDAFSFRRSFRSILDAYFTKSD